MTTTAFDLLGEDWGGGGGCSGVTIPFPAGALFALFLSQYPFKLVVSVSPDEGINTSRDIRRVER